MDARIKSFAFYVLNEHIPKYAENEYELYIYGKSKNDPIDHDCYARKTTLRTLTHSWEPRPTKT